MVKILVTGGGGFLGGAIVRMLRERGDAVRSFSRQRYPMLGELGVESRVGDLSDAEAVLAAVRGCDAVIHTAAKPGVWGPFAEYFAANVLGTQNILDACRAEGVRKLVYTSSPSVVHAGGDLENADESLPYPAHYETHYPKTKAEAERRVLAANGPELAAVALRPHLIWGPGDHHLTPRILARGKAGRLRRIGSAEKLVDATYIDNAAAAHLNALDRLDVGAACAGKPYFIANDEPQPIWTLINGILDAGGLPPVTRAFPLWAGLAVGGVLEAVYSLLRLPGEPPMTRFVARQLATAHWFNLSAAKCDLGYRPTVTTEEGLERLRRELQGAT
jgi:nucleoside-diphosphate-sugar epimerase